MTLNKLFPEQESGEGQLAEFERHSTDGLTKHLSWWLLFCWLHGSYRTATTCSLASDRGSQSLSLLRADGFMARPQVPGRGAQVASPCERSATTIITPRPGRKE